MLELIYRRGLLAVANLPPVAGFVKRFGWRLGVGRFVAGEELEHAIAALKRLDEQGLAGILDLLGEFVASPEGVSAMVQEIEVALARLASAPQRAMSVKPAQLGLGLREGALNTALANARYLARRAQQAGVRLCFDMENHPYVDGTLTIYRTLHAEGFDNICTVLQSYLKRSLRDLDELLPLTPKPVLRLVKGAYLEPEHVAYQEMAQVDSLLLEMVYRGLDAGAHIDIATHDETLIHQVEAFVRGAKIPADGYEFQLLYGVKPKLQRALRQRGHRVRIYVPYGKDWYGYYSRRLAERPANLAFVLRGLFG
jgi:proline dehydrogenase